MFFSRVGEGHWGCRGYRQQTRTRFLELDVIHIDYWDE